MPTQPNPAAEPRASRRLVFTGALSGCALLALAGCGSSEPSGGNEPSTPAADAGPLAKAADIPVGGGVIFADQKIVVTQPVEGTFEAFSAACTHQGFTVGKVADGTITCTHHGSQFDAATGEVTNGPATKPLAALKVEVKDGEVFVTS